ncbi:acyl-CoA thioesterase I [Methylomarinovum tepidoasis]|uniref:Acyl-CoA thioesterase I n=1 Tax=Methylomarinovum tepidoasis TaxID=2840183 RepID=A0AAU9C9S2_9GAMM|nr:arylesterase [Methylomarinovum sp. IN45]BCX88667.1 acyl-CoA thioesterase I [Methylomarinovum sp. IN45]
MRIAGILLLWLLSPAGWAVTVLVLGDSLSAGYGIDVERGWVALLEKRLQKEHKGARVVNASISGETTAGGRRRLPALLARHRPDIVILELGGNDGLRGIPPQRMAANLAAMIDQARQAGARVLLLGMKIPANYGPRYRRQFEAVFQRLARNKQVAFVPFFLQDVALRPGLMQADGIHPNAEAQDEMLARVWPALAAMLN